MARLVPTPQALIEQLLRLLPHHAPPRPVSSPGPGTEERILDTALKTFTERGIRATTMSQLARDAGISREWLYKFFRNRDAVVLAVTRREVVRFVDGLAMQAFRSDDLTSAVTDAFVYANEFLRDHALLQRVLRTESNLLGPRFLTDTGPVMAVAVRAAAGYLSALGDLEPDEATTVAETLVRLTAIITVAPDATLDLHDPDTLRRYAATVVPAVLAGARAERTPAGPA